MAHFLPWLVLVSFFFASYLLIRTMLYMGNSYFTAMSLIALLYPLGKVLQTWIIGPGWIRWHMDDVGWISCIGILLAFGNISPGKTLTRRLITGVHLSFAIALFMEFLQLNAGKPHPGKGVYTAAGDWVDMAIFFVMYLVNGYLVLGFKNQMLAAKEEAS